jgi:hypothetical protein
VFFGVSRHRGIRTPSLRLVLGVLEDRAQRIDAFAPQSIPGVGIDELVEELRQLHYVAIRIEDDPLAGVSHRLPFQRRN